MVRTFRLINIVTIKKVKGLIWSTNYFKASEPPIISNNSLVIDC